MTNLKQFLTRARQVREAPIVKATQFHDKVQIAHRNFDTLLDALEKAVGTLEFYSKDTTSVYQTTTGFVGIDDGKRARDTLSELDELFKEQGDE